MNKIYFVRHGETEWNKTGKYQGGTDVPLNEIGLLQAKRCAEVMKRVHIDRIISSDLSRATVTANIINEKHRVPLRLDAGLREISFGDWEGLTYEQISAKWPGAIEEMYSKPSQLTISNGESFQMVQTRAWAALKQEISLSEDGETILVVCHGGTIRVLLCQILGMNLDHAWNFRQGNTAISYVDYYGDNGVINTLGMLNYLDHIRDLEHAGIS